MSGCCRQRPITGAAEMIDVKAVTVIRWVKRMRQWIRQLDPSGYWEVKVRLGMEIRPVVNRPRCGSADTVHCRGFASDTGERKCRCDNCGRYCRLSEALREGEEISAIEHRVVKRPPSSRRKLQAQ
ncbi:DUF746 domain-containing protein [Rhizobium rhizogenes]|uniref:DUF746 domain-containing protein n=2 Tax=Rhizobium rhizogenes TaxID=359 RepID=UPI001F44532A|nr:DUF746 domain-containing protein [Rhizobium rhizogenes]